jgi:hypothetical protein
MSHRSYLLCDSIDLEHDFIIVMKCTVCFDGVMTCFMVCDRVAARCARLCVTTNEKCISNPDTLVNLE